MGYVIPLLIAIGYIYIYIYIYTCTLLLLRGPGATRRGAWGARTVRATAAAVGPEAVRGAWGGHGLGEGGGAGVLNVIKNKSSKYKEKTEMRKFPGNQSLTCDLQCVFTFYQKPEMIPGSIRTFW